MTGSHEVRGSIPLGSTNPVKTLTASVAAFRFLVAKPFSFHGRKFCLAPSLERKLRSSNIRVTFSDALVKASQPVFIWPVPASPSTSAKPNL